MIRFRRCGNCAVAACPAQAGLRREAHDANSLFDLHLAAGGTAISSLRTAAGLKLPETRNATTARTWQEVWHQKKLSSKLARYIFFVIA
jgi:hypothetical protein